MYTGNLPQPKGWVLFWKEVKTMKKFKILLKSGLFVDNFEAESLEDLMKKINSGHYHILPIRSDRTVSIARKDLESIIEVNDR